MPSPLVHSAVGVAIYRLWSARSGPPRPEPRALSPLLVICVVLSLLPDLDSAVGLAFGDMGRFHNNLAGSPVFATMVALAVGGATAFPLFYGVRWSDGLLSAKHLVTLVTELAFLLILWLALRRTALWPRG